MKKANISFKMVIIIVIVVTIAFEAINFSMVAVKKDRVFKASTLEDLETMVNTLVAVPGNALVKYPQNRSDYTIVLTDNTVTMFKDEPENLRSRRFFSLPVNYSARGVVDQGQQFCLEKIKKTITLRSCDDI